MKLVLHLVIKIKIKDKDEEVLLEAQRVVKGQHLDRLAFGVDLVALGVRRPLCTRRGEKLWVLLLRVVPRVPIAATCIRRNKNMQQGA